MDEMGSYPNVRGGAEYSVFNTSKTTASKLAFVPGSRLYCDKDVCCTNVCGKSHQD